MIRIKDEAFLSKGEEEYQSAATMSGDKNDEIKGTVFELTADELLAADNYEPGNYKRIVVTLESGMDAWIYVADEI